MKFFEGLRNLIGHKDALNKPANSVQSDADRETGLRQNEAQIRTAIEGGYAVAADHTRLEQIKGHIATLEAKRASQQGPATAFENPTSPTPIKNDIDRRLSEISQLKSKKPVA